MDEDNVAKLLGVNKGSNIDESSVKHKTFTDEAGYGEYGHRTYLSKGGGAVN